MVATPGVVTSPSAIRVGVISPCADAEGDSSADDNSMVSAVTMASHLKRTRCVCMRSPPDSDLIAKFDYKGLHYCFPIHKRKLNKMFIASNIPKVVQFHGYGTPPFRWLRDLWSNFPISPPEKPCSCCD
jgi:hypothetical protein